MGRVARLERGSTALTPRRLTELLAGAGVRGLAPLASDPVILGVRVDSRRVGSGDLFLAFPGSKVDGVRFAGDAVARGAVAVLAGTAPPRDFEAAVAWVRVEDARRAGARVAREWFERPDEALTLVGITGTKGKTTVAYLVESIARSAGRSAGRIGTVGHAFAGREVVAERTTPESVDFYALLAAMRDAGTEVVAMEVSSHALALGRVEGARFAVAAFLNLGHDHLDFHRDLQSYFDAKARLFDGLGPRDRAVIPSDDPHGARLAERTRADLLRYGRSDGSDVRIVGETHAAEGSRIVLRLPSGEIEIASRLAGRFNVDNVAAAAACAVAIGIPGDAIARGVAALERVPGRVDRVDEGQPFGVFVDYAHTPESLGGVLSAARELARGRVLVVFGCGGDRDRAKRPEMGRVAALLADLVVLTSDNPRSEDPVAILRDIESGVAAVAGAASRTRVEPDRRAAVRLALAEARPGDVVIVAGKGHETTQTFADRVEPLDDREIVREALRRLGHGGGARGNSRA